MLAANGGEEAEGYVPVQWRKWLISLSKWLNDSNQRKASLAAKPEKYGG